MRRTDVVQDDGSSAAAELASLEETFRGAAARISHPTQGGEK